MKGPKPRFPKKFGDMGKKKYYSYFLEKTGVARNAVEFIIDDLELLLTRELNFGSILESFREDLTFFRFFLRKVQDHSPEILSPIVKDLVVDITPVVEELLIAADVYVARKSSTTAIVHFFPLYSSRVSDFVKRIKSVEQQGLLPEGCNNDDLIRNSCSASSSDQTTSVVLEGNEFMVGFDDEFNELQAQLTGGRERLEFISIVGMGGIGKTTLAKRLYNDPAVVYHFHLRAWTYASRDYEEEILLPNILSCLVDDKDSLFKKSTEEMGEKLYKCLKGNRYLIVMDDIGYSEAWDKLCMYFPDDGNCSRILMTSRTMDLGSKNRPEISVHSLRFMTFEESWKLLECKVFVDKRCPEELIEIGMSIVARCHGLPLAIVVIAGLLANEEKTESYWSHVAETIRLTQEGEELESYWGNSNRLECMIERILEFSYEYLSPSLKSCFLYIGTFQTGYEISVRRLIRRWIAEGFVEGMLNKRLEDVAQDFLKQLINRSLVMVAKRSSDGGIKSLSLHYWLRYSCLQIGKLDRKFLQPICSCPRVRTNIFFHVTEEMNRELRFQVFSKCSSYSHLDWKHYRPEREVFHTDSMSNYKFLKTLDFKDIMIMNFPHVVLQLLHLTYLALSVDCIDSVLPPIYELWNLETCIFEVEKGGRVEVPEKFWEMVKLRHLQISQELIFSDNDNLSQQQGTPRAAGVLENLQTISQLCPSRFIDHVLARIPNCRKLGFHFTLSDANKQPFCFPDLAKLKLLERLKFEYQTFGMMISSAIPHPEKFPSTLKKLTLVGTLVNWDAMSMIGLLPNLEVLKIKNIFDSGLPWETSDDGFSRLRFLKLSHVDLRTWISSSDHFPRLQQLVLNGCLDLEEIPSEFGDIPTLLDIKVYRSSTSVVESAMKIDESWKSMGNNDLKVFIYHQFEEFGGE